VFPGQTRAPYHKTVDVVVTTVAEGLMCPGPSSSCRADDFSSRKRQGRLRVINKDGLRLHTITANMPPVYFRGQAGLLDVALDRNFATNHRIFFCYVRVVDADNSALSVDSAVLNETPARSPTSPTSFTPRPSPIAR
jgi:glucose/arabinose dehydrogenase